MMPVAIICGGMGTRLFPLTEDVPKSLVPVCGKPFIHHQLELIKKKGVQNVVLCVGKFGEQIETYVQDGSAWGLDVKYSYDGDEPLGTGGAVKKALPLLPEKFFVMYGDSYLDTNWFVVSASRLYYMTKNLMTFYHGIDYGLEVLDKEMLDDFPLQQFDIWKFYDHATALGEMAKLRVSDPFYEVGSFDGIKKLEKHLCPKTM